MRACLHSLLSRSLARLYPRQRHRIQTTPIQLHDPASFECADAIAQKPRRRHVDVNSPTLLFDVTTNDKDGKEWKAFRGNSRWEDPCAFAM